MTYVHRLAVALLATGCASVAACAETAAMKPMMKPSESDQRAQKLKKGEQELEAAALQVLLAPMFPAERTGLFGTGSAGKYWQSMLTEQIAKQIAAGGQVRLLPAKAGKPKRGTAGNVIPAAAMVPQSACTAPNCPAAGMAKRGWQTTVHRPPLSPDEHSEVAQSTP